jgi:gliding motility-associated-like protein
VALVGETGYQLQGPLRRGSYQVRATGKSTCFLTESFFFSVPFEYTRQEVDICPGEEHFFAGEVLSIEGTYYDTLKSAGNCDSIIELQLNVLNDAADTVYAGLFGSEIYSAGEYALDEPGDYVLNFKTARNCDSLVFLQLDRYQAYVPDAFSPNGDGVNDFFTVQGDENLESVPLFQVYNRWGGRVFSATDLDPLQGWDGRDGSRLASPGVYIYKARLLFRDEKERIVTGSVTLVR